MPVSFTLPTAQLPNSDPNFRINNGAGMNISDQFPQLMKSSIFEGMKKAEIRDFLDRCHSKTYRSKTIVLKEGALAASVFIVAHGKLDIFTTSGDGTKILLHRARRGEIVGELETIAQKPCVATCQTGANTTLVACSEALLLQTLSSRVFMKNLMATLYYRLERANKFKIVDSCFTTKQRICAYLLYLSDADNTVSDNQSFLAELTGCSRQTINRELGVLRDQGILNVTARRIDILDRAALQTVSGIKD